ncbi:S8 family peptidase [Vallitalea okinawensis]|uniref:S8 family peptidase n=1 Tax=Vallitalea okinawensis TaxID=2078660 RepID=UPI000CFC6E82|nr:S8 family peptidase [Vallitalea okinawensis]
MRQENIVEDLNCHRIITSDNYVDVWYRVDEDLQKLTEEIGAECFQVALGGWGIAYFKVEPEEGVEFYSNSDYVSLPVLFGLSSMSSLDSAGITPIINNKALDLTGNGVIVAIIDTGIDYTHEAFINDDNTSKIMSIWDQTVEGNPPMDFLYGAEYTNLQINEALKSDNPLSIVPSTDAIGHGTLLAGLAAGKANLQVGFQGAAPGADLIIVKLKPAKKYLKDFYQINEDAIAFQGNDMSLGLKYVLDKSKELNKPIVVLNALESNAGPHNGSTYKEQIMAKEGTSYGVVIVSVAGNEANSGHHYHGIFKKDKERINVDLNIAESERGINFSIWSPLPDQVSIELITPSGFSTGPIPFKENIWQSYIIPTVKTIVHIRYDLIEERTMDELIVVRIEHILPGIWTLVVHGNIVIVGEFDIYLPIRGFIDEGTSFLKPDPDVTIVNPSSNSGIITVGAYNEKTTSIYLPSGRGFTRDDRVKPDIVAPGVNVIGPYPNGEYVKRSGTSISAAITAGASAILLEWGIIKGNNPTINTVALRTYLARGAKKRNGVVYPNQEWGYGQLDLMSTFKKLF